MLITHSLNEQVNDEGINNRDGIFKEVNNKHMFRELTLSPNEKQTKIMSLDFEQFF